MLIETYQPWDAEIERPSVMLAYTIKGWGCRWPVTPEPCSAPVESADRCTALGTHQYALGVDCSGESGTIADLHEVTGISTGNIVNAALIAISELGLTDDERPTLRCSGIAVLDALTTERHQRTTRR